MLLSLDFAAYKDHLRLKSEDGKRYVFGHIRKKWLVLTPEEFIRQLIVHYLIEKQGYNKNRITVERKVELNELTRRCDILVYNEKMEAQLLIECKSYKVNLSQAVFDQVANYNISLGVPYLMVSNGGQTYCCEVSKENKTYEFLRELPVF